MTTRKCADIVDTFQKVCQKRATPSFALWAGILMVAGVMGRKCYVMTGKNKWTDFVYPTLGVFLISPGGGGKTSATKVCEEFWAEIPSLCVAPKSLTAASFCDTIGSSGKGIEDHHSLLIVSDELLSFFLGYDREQLAYWSQAIDCSREISQQRRGLGKDKIGCLNPSLSFLLAGTPGAFNTYFPEAAYDQGLMGRCVIVYHRKKHRGKAHPRENKLGEDCIHDLGLVADMEGKFTLESGVLKLFEEEDLKNEEMIDRLPHPRLEPYFNRKHMLGLKVAMAISAARSDNMIITQACYKEALKLLGEAETCVVQAFVAPKQEEDALVIDSTMRHFWETGVKRIKKRTLVQRLYPIVAASKVPILIDTMVNAGLLKDMETYWLVGPDPRKLEGVENVEELEPKTKMKTKEGKVESA